MIDYWEAMGRLATDKELHEKFQSVQPAEDDISAVAVPAKYDAEALAVKISGPDYQKVQDTLSPVLTEQFLSLMSAGELIWTYKFKESRDAITTLNGVINAQPPLPAPSTGYFIALGLVIVDGIFRKQVASAGQNCAGLLPRLSPAELARLVMLVAIAEFETACVAVARFPWDVGCNVSLRYWNGHLHPRGIDAPASKENTDTAAAAAAHA